jgi:hypothetical protein
VLALLAGGIVAVRAATTGHAPDVVDAGLAALAAAVVVRAGAPALWARATVPFVFGAAASVATSMDPWSSGLSLTLVLGMVAFAGLALAHPTSRRDADGVLFGLVVGGALHAVVAGWQRFVLWPDALAHQHELALPATVVARLASLRPLGLSLSPDLGAAVALAGLAAALALVVDGHRSSRLRALAAAAAVGGTCAIVLSRSFGALVAIGVAFVVVAAVRRKAWVLLPLVVLGAAGAPTIWGRGVGALALSAHERWLNWQVGWHAFLEAPATGHGLLRFASVYVERRPPEANVTRYAHSAPVQLLVETGLVGGLAAVVVLVLVGPRLLQALRSHHPSRVILAGGVVALGTRACIDYDLHVGQTAMLFAALVGLACRNEEDTAAPPTGPAAAADPSWPPPRGVAAAVAVGALVLAGALQARATVDGTSWLARVDVDVALRAAVQDPDPAARRALLARFSDRVPAAAVVAARAALHQGDVDEALSLLDAALRRDRSLVAAHELVVALARAGHGDVAAREAEARRWNVVVP